jgi:hypothetical protein
MHFWRVAGGRDTVIEDIAVEGGEVTVSYDFVRLRLLVAGEVAGPYREASGFVIDERARTITLPRQEGHRFFRLAGNARARIIEVETTAAEVGLTYALVP